MDIAIQIAVFLIMMIVGLDLIRAVLGRLVERPALVVVATVNTKSFMLGPFEGGKMQLRIRRTRSGGAPHDGRRGYRDHRCRLRVEGGSQRVGGSSDDPRASTIFGLLVATVLTLIFVPVPYSIIFQIRPGDAAESS